MGVDAFRAGIDSLAGARLPVVALYTNRLGAVGPAVMRRSAAAFIFTRSGEEQRMRSSLRRSAGSASGRRLVRNGVELTGPLHILRAHSAPVPAAALRAFPSRLVTDEELLAPHRGTTVHPLFTEEH